MIKVSNNLMTELERGTRLFEVAKITFADGTVKTIEDELLNTGNSFSDAAESSGFPLGVAVCKNAVFCLDNSDGAWTSYNFVGAAVSITLRMDFDDGTSESIDRGVYTVYSAEVSDQVITVTALDAMQKANITYTSELELPQTIETLLKDACKLAGITSNVTSMTHGSLAVSSIPQGTTVRQVIALAALVESGNARMSRKGELEIIPWDFSATPVNVDNFKSDPTFSSDDIVITGIKITNSTGTALSGEEGYILGIESDLVDSDNIATVAGWVGEKLIGATFRSMEGDLICDPRLEFGDMVKSYDYKGNGYLTPLTDVSYEHNGFTTIKTQAEEPAYTSSEYVTPATKAYIKARELVNQETQARKADVSTIEQALENASGMYQTDVKQPDGSVISYIHDKPTLEGSTNIIKITSEAIGLSNDGGKTYPYGMALTGDVVARLLYAHGINADYIDAGTFTVQDSSGNIIFSANKDDGSVVIDGATIRIGSNALTQTITDLQNEVDGNIQTWTGEATPTLSNYPASSWTTDEEKQTHVGDVYYDEYNQAYRFRYGSNGYEWQLLKDTDVTKALSDSAEALENSNEAISIANMAKNMTMQLSNDYASVPVDSDGKYTTFPEITTQPIVMYGSTDISSACAYTIQKSDYVSGVWNSSTRTYTVTALTADTGWVSITARYLSPLSVTKQMTIAKLYAGETGATGAQGVKGDKGDKGDAGADGTSITIKSKSVTYQAGTSGTTTPTGTWSTSIPSVAAGSYLWTKTTVTYSDGTSTISYSVARQGANGTNGTDGTDGADGKDGTSPTVSSTVVQYVQSTSGTTTPTSGWSTTPPTATAGQYMWTKTTVTYSDGKTAVSYTVSKNGTNGTDGTAYSISCDASIIKKGEDNLLIPSRFTATAYSSNASSGRTTYNGRFVIEESADEGKTWTTVYTSSANESSVTHQLYTILVDKNKYAISTKEGYILGMPRDITNIRVSLYMAGGTTKLLDQQNISVVSDVSALTQEELVAALTNDGEWKGLYYLNGHLYISFDSALGGTIKLGGKNNGNGLLTILDENGNQVGLISKDGSQLTAGKIGKWTISDKGIYNGSGTVESMGDDYRVDSNHEIHGIYMGTDGVRCDGEFASTTIESGSIFVHYIEPEYDEEMETTGYYDTGDYFSVGGWTPLYAAIGIQSGDEVPFRVTYDGQLHAQSIYYGSLEQYSDVNLKDNIVEFSDAYESFFEQLRPITFNYKVQDTERKHFGYIAQDVEKALVACGLSDQFALISKKELRDKEYTIDRKTGQKIEVDHSETNYLLDQGVSEKYSLSYTEMIALNTHMIQKCMARIDELEKQIKELKGETNG